MDPPLKFPEYAHETVGSPSTGHRRNIYSIGRFPHCIFQARSEERKF